MKKTTLAIAASLLLNHCHSAQDVRLMTTDDQILKGIVHANVVETSYLPKKVVDKAYSDAVNELRRCENYAADRESIYTLRSKMSAFYHDQGIGDDYIFKVPIHMLSCDISGLDLRHHGLPNCFRILIVARSSGVKSVDEAVILPNKQAMGQVFKVEHPITRVPLGFLPKHGQEFAPTCSISSDCGMKIMDLIESIPARFAHESGHYYYTHNCKAFKKKRTKAVQEKTAVFEGLSLVSEIPAWLFEFRYRITHENDLKTGDAYDVIGRVERMLDLEYDKPFARCSNLALSIASLTNVNLKTLVDRTIKQLTPMWSGANVVKSFENCEIVDDAAPEEYGITFDKKQNSFVMKYNAAANLTIMKRWLGKLGYENVDATIEKIRSFRNEAASELKNAK